VAIRSGKFFGEVSDGSVAFGEEKLIVGFQSPSVDAGEPDCIRSIIIISNHQ
jgi:hypothetical protein